MRLSGVSGAKITGGIVLRQRADRYAARIRRLGAEAARVFQRAQQHLQQVQARGRSGSRWNARRRRASRASRPAARSTLSCVRPCMSVQRIGNSTASSKATARHFQRDARDGLGGNTALRGHALGRIAIVEIALGREREHGLGMAAFGKLGRCDTAPARCRAGSPLARLLHVLIPDQRLTVGAAREQAVARRSPASAPPATAHWCSG